MSKALLEARIATLEAELAASREDAKLAWAEASMGPTEAAITHELAQSQAHANALRDALVRKNMALRVMVEEAQSFSEFSKFYDLQRAMDAALAECADMAAFNETPAASLAAHNAEVLERAATECVVAVHAPDDMQHDPIRLETFDDAVGMCAAAIRALAAQAATHSVPDGTSEVKP